MKHLKVSFFLLGIMVAIGLSACKKIANSPPALTNVYFTFDSTLSVSFLHPVGTYATSNGEFELYANNGTTATFEIYVTKNLSAGTYDIASGQAEIVYASAATSGSGSLINASVATSGTVVISTYSTTEVAGTFSFSGKDPAGNTYKVTNGNFITGYSSVTTIPAMFTVN